MIRSRARFYCALSLPRPAETLITREDGNFHPRTIPTGKPWPNGRAAKSRCYLRSSDDNRGQRASSFVAVISRHALRRWTINSSVAARQIWIQKIGAPQRITSVLMRLGTSPTGMFATTFIALVSMADTDLIPEFET